MRLDELNLKTLVLPANDTDAFAHAVRLLRAGNAIAYPTDTVYGLGANGFDERAIEMLFRVKDRPLAKAIPYLLARAEDLEIVASRIPRAAAELAARFWPGGLTMVVPAGARVPHILNGGTGSVAVRVPDHPTTRALIDSAGTPLATTSANLSGARDPSTAIEVLEQLSGRIPLILDGGPTRGNVPSTVVDLLSNPPVVRRIGVISIQSLRSVLGDAIAVET